MADNPQQTIRELRELIVEYAKQETVEPLTGLGKYAGFGIGGAVMIGVGYLFFAIGALRLLQGWGPLNHGHRFNGNMSWAPYLIVMAGSLVLAGLVWAARGKRKSSAGRGRTR